VWAPGVVAAGTRHTCGIVSGGRVACWGDDGFGQLGDGGLGAHASPTLVDGVDSASMLSAGERRTCALVDGARVRCWGGERTHNGHSEPPVDVRGIEDAVEIATSTWLSCARRRSGKVTCWGSDQTLHDLRDVEHATAISAGPEAICAIVEGGAVWCASGAIPNAAPSVARPVDDVKGAVAIAHASATGCALLASGKVRCWSYARGLDDVLPGVSAELPGVADGRDITGGVDGICVAEASTARCFKSAVAGRGPRGVPILADVALDDVPELRSYAGVAIGGEHACGVTREGALFCWGTKEDLLGANGHAEARVTPAKVEGVEGAVEILAGDDTTCARRADGHVVCWGDGPATGSRGWRGSSVVGGVERATGLAGGSEYVCALRGRTEGLCWGLAEMARCAPPTWGRPCKVPLVETPRLTHHLFDVPGAVALGDSCAVRANGTVTCAQPSGGQPAMRDIEGVHGATSVAGWCALTRDGTVLCWGNNDVGQLGDGTSYRRADAVTVVGLAKIDRIGAGISHACALGHDGSVRCWGGNEDGAVGDGSRTDAHRPVAPTGLSAAKGIAVGWRFSCALGVDGTVSCWGSNASGALGDGTFDDRARPAKVLGVTDAVEIAAGRRHACARRSDGSVWCWGFDATVKGSVPTVKAPRRVPEPPRL
jgi:alpha-tubulin suppressor-like RCC1 family protein